MNSGGWGPFPKLAEQLAKVAPYTLRGYDYGAVRALNELGGPWDIYAQGPELTGGGDPLWPRALPSPRPRRAAPSPGYFSSYTEYLYELFAGAQQAPCHPERVDREALRDSAIECTFWLGGRLKGYLRQSLASFWRDVPAGLFDVTEAGLVWTTYAYLLDRWGPRVAQSFVPSRTGHDPAHMMTAADALAVHMNVERLVEKLSAQLPLVPLTASGARRPGGLRTPSFLRSYPALAVSARRSDKRRRWLDALEVLLRASPLTHIVYLDLMRDGLAPAGCAAAVRFGAAAWGHDFWISQVARSLVAALLSPPHGYESWAAAAQEVQRLEALDARRRSGAGLLMKNFAPSRELFTAREYLRSVGKQLAEQYVERLRGLGNIKEASPYLHQRALDMLVRHLVTVLMPELERWWESNRSGLPRAGYEMFRKPGRFHDRLVGVLLGHQPDELWRLLSGDTRRNLLPLLSQALDPATHIEAESLARQAGVPSSSASRLLERLLNDDRHGIALPFPPPNERAPATASILSSFLAQVSARLPTQEVTVDQAPA